MNNVQASVQKQFGNVAANYSTSTVHASGEDLRVMVEAAHLSGSEHVLDAGCGAGHTALTFAPHVAHVTAYDLTLPMLEQVMLLANERSIHNISTRHGDVEDLPFEPHTFDLVVSRYSAHHWPHPLLALEEFARVLKPGGLFLLSDVVAPDDHTQDTFLQTIELLRDPSHVRDHRIEEWSAMFLKARLQPETVFTWDIHLEFDSWVQRMATPHLNSAMLKTLFDGAPGEVRTALQLESDYSFTIPGALLRGKLT
jgi:ubiquinone/menaquinone biosynthesis C-methylase UbiE